MSTATLLATLQKLDLLKDSITDLKNIVTELQKVDGKILSSSEFTEFQKIYDTKIKNVTVPSTATGITATGITATGTTATSKTATGTATTSTTTSLSKTSSKTSATATAKPSSVNTLKFNVLFGKVEKKINKLNDKKQTTKDLTSELNKLKIDSKKNNAIKVGFKMNELKKLDKKVDEQIRIDNLIKNVSLGKGQKVPVIPPGGKCKLGNIFTNTTDGKIYFCRGPTGAWVYSGSTGTAEVLSGSGNPSGPCDPGKAYVDTSSGDIYFCGGTGATGTWSSSKTIT